MLGHNYIGTEHLLLGLAHEGEGVAARALEVCGVSVDRVRAEVLEIVGHGEGQSSGHIPFTPRAKKVLELSLREALALGHNYIGTEHILLGVLRENEGIGAQVLQKSGADLDRVRRAVIEVVSEYGQVERGRTEYRELSVEEIAKMPLPALKAHLLHALERLGRIEDELREVREAVEGLHERLDQIGDEGSGSGEAAT